MDDLNCLKCDYKHKVNGNCTAVGGFCTAVPAAYCRKLKEYMDTGLTPEEVGELVKMEAVKSIADAADVSLARVEELAAADKDGRVVALPRYCEDCIHWHREYADRTGEHGLCNDRLRNAHEYCSRAEATAATLKGGAE